MDFITALLSDSGTASTVRLMSLISLVVGCIIGLYGMYMGTNLGGVTQLTAVFVGAAFAGKVGQKVIEGNK